MDKPDIPALVARVRKLYALAEGNNNPHLAAEALRKAQELIDRYDLDMAAVYYIQERAMDLQEVVITYRNRPHEQDNDWIALLLYTLAKYHFCYTIHYDDHTKVIGPTNNVTHTMKMFTHISRQIERLSDDRAVRHGIASRVRSHLVVRRGKEVHTAGFAIIAQHRTLIDAYVRQRYPDALRENFNPALLGHPRTFDGAWEDGFAMVGLIDIDVPEHSDRAVERPWSWMLGDAKNDMEALSEQGTQGAVGG